MEKMEKAVSEIIGKFDIFMNDDTAKCSFRQHLSVFCNEIQFEMERMINECIEERKRSEKAEISFHNKLTEIAEKLDDLEILSEIEIDTFLASRKWFSRSVEEFNQEYEKGNMNNRTAGQQKKLLKTIENVKTDAVRLLMTVKEGMENRIHTCNSISDEYDNLTDLLKLVRDSIHKANSEISVTTHTNPNFKELRGCIMHVDECSNNLAEKLIQIQSNQKRIFKERTMMFNPSDENFRILMESKNSPCASGLEKRVIKIIESFIKDNRGNNGKLEMKDIRPVLLEANKTWRDSFDQEVRSEFDRINSLYNEFEDELKKSRPIIETLKVKVQNLESDLAEIKIKNEKLEEELKEKTQKCVSLDDKISALQSRYEDVQGEIREHENSVKLSFTKLSEAKTDFRNSAVRFKNEYAASGIFASSTRSQSIAQMQTHVEQFSSVISAEFNTPNFEARKIEILKKLEHCKSTVLKSSGVLTSINVASFDEVLKEICSLTSAVENDLKVKNETIASIGLLLWMRDSN